MQEPYNTFSFFYLLFAYFVSSLVLYRKQKGNGFFPSLLLSEAIQQKDF